MTGVFHDPDPGPLVDALVDEPDDERSWVWPDGRLHREPPAPAARVYFMETGAFLPAPFYPVVEAPPCGAIRDVPPAETSDGQRRRFVCDRPRGHPAPDPEAAGMWREVRPEDPGLHRAVVGTEPDQSYGRVTTWPVEPAPDSTEIMGGSRTEGDGDG